jgi:hypothetical protein
MGLQELDDFHEKQDENDEQDKADSAAAVVAETWPHAIAAKAEHQNQNDQKNKHLCFSPFGEVSPNRRCDADFVVNAIRNYFAVIILAQWFLVKMHFWVSC